MDISESPITEMNLRGAFGGRSKKQVPLPINMHEKVLPQRYLVVARSMAKIILEIDFLREHGGAIDTQVSRIIFAGAGLKEITLGRLSHIQAERKSRHRGSLNFAREIREGMP